MTPAEETTTTDLWLADWDKSDTGGHTLVVGREEAEQLASEWLDKIPQPVMISIAPVRLCNEDDPDLYRYDYDYESYFALTAPLTTIDR